MKQREFIKQMIKKSYWGICLILLIISLGLSSPIRAENWKQTEPDVPTEHANDGGLFITNDTLLSLDETDTAVVRSRAAINNTEQLSANFTIQTAVSRFYYRSVEENGQTNPKLWHWNASSWDEITGSTIGGDGDGLWIEASTTSYSPFAISNSALSPVDLIINEIMQNPAAVTDANGEWFEIYNAETVVVDIDGYVISDLGSNIHTIDSAYGTTTIAAGDYLTLCENPDSDTNGGVTCDYDFPSGFQLANGDDEIILKNDLGQEVDRVEWDGGPDFPDPTGKSMCLVSPSADNNVGSNWEESAVPYGDGDLGTPGESNYDCNDGGTGPGGIGENDGTSALRIWLKADIGTSTTTDGQSVSSWADQSGNNYDASQATSADQPTFETNELNGNPMISFDGNNDNLVGSPPTYTGNTVTGYTVARRESSVSNSSTVTFWDSTEASDFNNLKSFVLANDGSNLQTWRVAALSAHPHPGDGIPYIFGTLFDGTNNTAYLNGTADPTPDASSGVFSWDRYAVGARWSVGSLGVFYQGDEAEIIVYGAALNSAERIIVENYLSAKYNITVADDNYVGDDSGNGDFDFDVAGIGRESDGTHSLSHGGGIIVRDVFFLNDNGDYVLFGRQTTDCTETNTDVPITGDWATAPNPAHWGCSWYVDVTDVGPTAGTGLVDIAFDYSEAGFPNGATPSAPISNYGLLRRFNATGQYTDITASCVGGGVFISDDRIIFTDVDITCLGSNFTLGSKDTSISPLPVTLSYIQAAQVGNTINFEWQTATETGNMGFNLYVQTKDGLQQINSNLILSKEMSSLQAIDYSYSAAVSDAQTFYIEDIDISGKSKMRGPFALGQAYGRKAIEIPIDWNAINAEHNAKAAARSAAATQDAQARIQSAAASSSGPLLTLGVSQTGLYRVSHVDLLAAGLDLSGVSLDDIALAQGSTLVPITVIGSGGLFDANSSIEFYGQAIDTLYSKENIYTLHIDAALAARANTDNSAPSGSPSSHYLETVDLGDDKRYEPGHPDTPWFDTRMIAIGSATSASFNIDVDNYVAGAAPATLTVNVVGVTDWPQNPDHHITVDFGGSQVGDELFDGAFVAHPFSVELAAGLLQNGANSLQINVPGDLGTQWDVINVVDYGLTYPRSFVAKADGQLSFTTSGTAFQVDGLPDANVIVYRYDIGSGSLTEVTNVAVSGVAGNYSASFAGSGSTATYLVYSETQLLTPALRPARPYNDITSGTADYLMLAHSDFIADLAPLVAFHENNGLTVKVVDVADVFDQYSDGIFSPQAIKDYVQYAATNMGIEYLLLVGGDTYDYFDNLGFGSLSFIPSPYMSTGSIVNFAPADPFYADVDGDLVPDLKMGRFPVQSSAELTAMIDKTLLYDAANYKETAVFSADITSERSYMGMSNNFASYLPDNWQIETAYLDELELEAARSTLIDSINGGVGLTSYVGHSGTNQWTFNGLFYADDAGALTNVGQPTAVAQWGCWNTYHAHPGYSSLGHQFMQGDSGAAIVLGASTLTRAESEEQLGQAFMAYMAQGNMSFGEALQLAKADVASSAPGLLDVQLGYTLLGDPALQLAASSCAPAPTPTNVTIASNGSTVDLSWDDMGVAVDHYEVWQSVADDYYFTPAGDCAATATCTVVDGTSVSLENGGVNKAYIVLAVNGCGEKSALESAQRLGTFHFGMAAGTP